MLKRIVSVSCNEQTITFDNEHFVLNSFNVSSSTQNISSMKYTIGEKYLYSSVSGRKIDMEFTIVGDTVNEVRQYHGYMTSVFVPLDKITVDIGDYSIETYVDSSPEATDSGSYTDYCRTYKVTLTALYPFFKNPILVDGTDLYIQDTLDGTSYRQNIGTASASTFRFSNPSASPASDFSLKATLTATPWTTKYRLKNAEHEIHVTFPDTMHPQIGDYFYYNSEEHKFELVIAETQSYPLEAGTWNLLNFVDSADILIYNYPGDNEIVLQYYNTTNNTWDNVQGNYELTASVEVLEV